MIKSSYTDKYVTKKKQAEDRYVINLRNVNDNFNKLYSDVMTANSYGDADFFNGLQVSALSRPGTCDEETGFAYGFDENQQSLQFADLCKEIEAAKIPVKGLLNHLNSA